MTRPTPIPNAPLLCENHEDHMQRFRSPKNPPEPATVAHNRGRWSAWLEGHPFTWACCACPWEALAAVCGQALFWAGVRDEPVAGAVFEAMEPETAGAGTLFAEVESA